MLFTTPSTRVIFSATGTQINSTDIEDRRALEGGLFISDDWKVADRLTLNVGVRASMFSLVGPGTFYDYDADGDPVDSTVYESGEFGKTYVVPEPRVAANFRINDKSSIKAAYVRNCTIPAPAHKCYYQHTYRYVDTKQHQCKTADRRPILFRLLPQL